VTIASGLVLIASALQVVEQRDRAEAQAVTAERVSEFLVSMLESSGLRGNDLDTANAYTILANINHRQENYAYAKTMAKSALALYEALSTQDRTRLAIGKVGLSQTLLRIDEVDEMLLAAQQARLCC
jgi:hypothetical protein